MYKERRYKKRIHRNRPFLLLGNEIDGRLFSDKKYFFKNLSELKKNLPETLTQIKGEGEWAFELYQVPSDYKIWHRWGYYKYPSCGIKLFKYDYMSLPIHDVEFHEKEITFVGARVDDFGKSENKIKLKISRLIWEYK
ncbi:MAG: hypothetical protein WD053_08510 [Gracilimonas sp.]